MFPVSPELSTGSGPSPISNRLKEGGREEGMDGGMDGWTGRRMDGRIDSWVGR